MSSPITLSGFNNIDFGSIVTSLMTQASIPLTGLQNRQNALGTQVSNFQKLSTQLSAVQTAAAALSTPDAIANFAATSSNSSAVSVSSGSGATAGHYDVIVQRLARTQVTASLSIAPDANTTVVADAGTLTIGGKDVTLTGGVTLQQLATAINGVADMPVRASVIQSGASAFRLVLTATASGQANAFTIQNSLSGGTGVTFTDTNGDGLSGNSTADNAVNAVDASVLVNNIGVTSASNTLSTVIPGSTITLLKEDPSATIAVDVAADSSALRTKVTDFITAYNGLVSFVKAQTTSAAGGDASSIGREPTVRALRNALRSSLLAPYATGGPYDNLSQAGLEFTQTGTLQLNSATFDGAVSNGLGDITKLFSGNGSVGGAFAAVSALAEQYTQSKGLLSGVQDRLTAQIAQMDKQIADMQSRLALQKKVLQQQFTQADQAMSALNAQSGSLTSLGTKLLSSSS